MATHTVLRHPLQLHHHSNFHQPVPHRPQLKFPPPPRAKPIKPLICMSASYSPIPATDRLMSAASYCFPLFNGLHYGRFIFSQHPIVAVPFKPIVRFLSLYRYVPYASLIAFFTFYLGIVRNPKVSRYVRFNALQALVLDVVLVVPALVEQVLSPGLKVTVWGYNCLFVFLVACFSYALGCSVIGKTPYLPIAADAANRQLYYDS